MDYANVSLVWVAGSVRPLDARCPLGLDAIERLRAVLEDIARAAREGGQ